MVGRAQAASEVPLTQVRDVIAADRVQGLEPQLGA